MKSGQLHVSAGPDLHLGTLRVAMKQLALLVPEKTSEPWSIVRRRHHAVLNRGLRPESELRIVAPYG